MTTFATPRTADSASVASHRPSPWWPVALPVAALAAGLAAVGAAGRQLWYDEYVTWFASTELSWAEFWRLLERIDAVHALYYAVMRLWTIVAGDSPLALRGPSLLGVAVAAGGITLLGRRLFGTTVGVTAGLLFAALPSVSRYGQEVRSYAWVTAAAVLSTLALLRAVEQPTRSRFVWYGVSLLALVHLHAVAVLLLVPHAALLLPRRRADAAPAGAVAPRPSRPLRGWLATVALVTLACVPLALRASGQSGQVEWIGRDRIAVERYPAELFGSSTIAWVIVPVAVLGAVVAWYARRGPLLPLLLWAALPPVVCYAAHPVVHLFLAKYALFTLPAWALLAALAIGVPAVALRRWLLPADQTVLLALAVLLVAAAGVGGQFAVRRSPTAGEADFRAAAEVIDRGYQPGDGIAFAGFDPSRSTRLPLGYELRDRPRDVFLAVAGARLGSYGSVECTDPAACLADTRRIWLVVGNAPDDPLAAFPPRRAALLRERFTVTSRQRLHRVDVLLVVHR